jgi:hypothetical protein
VSDGWFFGRALGSQPFACLVCSDFSHGDAEGAALHAVVDCQPVYQLMLRASVENASSSAFIAEIR